MAFPAQGRVPANPTAPTPVRDPRWLAHRYVEGADAFRFRWTPREAHRAATFLTDEQLGPDARLVELPRAAVLAEMRGAARAPLHFIFHSAFCCSTLLARALDRPGVAIALKEPVVLNDVHGWRRRGADPRAAASVLDVALGLLARAWDGERAVVVKPSNLVNAWAPVILDGSPGTRALLLHAPLPVYLGSVARKGLEGRLWVRDLLAKLLADGVVDLGIARGEWFGLTDLQVAAAGWLAQQRLFALLTARFASRVRALDSETLLARPGETIAALSELFGLGLDAAAVAEIATGPAFTRHSKGGGAFDRGAREAERASEAAYADEIGKVAAWAAKVAERAGIPLRLPAPLLG